MEYLMITYHMQRPGEVAESCIRLPMMPDVAADLLAGGTSATVDAILYLLALLQGYDDASFCCCEPCNDLSNPL